MYICFPVQSPPRTALLYGVCKCKCRFYCDDDELSTPGKQGRTVGAIDCPVCGTRLAEARGELTCVGESVSTKSQYTLVPAVTPGPFYHVPPPPKGPATDPKEPWN